MNCHMEYWRCWRQGTHHGYQGHTLRTWITALHPMPHNIGLISPTTTSPHEEEHILPMLRMNVSFTVRKFGTSAQSDGTPRLAPADFYQPQGPISTASPRPPSRRTSTINNRIITSDTSHHTPLLQTTRIYKYQYHSATRGREPKRITSTT